MMADIGVWMELSGFHPSTAEVLRLKEPQVLQMRRFEGTFPVFALLTAEASRRAAAFANLTSPQTPPSGEGLTAFGGECHAVNGGSLSRASRSLPAAEARSRCSRHSAGCGPQV